MIRKFAIALVPIVALATQAAAQSGATTITSKYSVAETVDRLEAAVKAESGFAIFGRIDYDSIAASQGGTIRPTRLVLFGRGRAVQPLLSVAPTLGLDLPLKVLVWEAGDGVVRVTFNSADFLKARHSRRPGQAVEADYRTDCIVRQESSRVNLPRLGHYSHRVYGHGPDRTNVVKIGPVPMEVFSAGTTELDQLVMFIVDATRPFSPSAKFE